MTIIHASNELPAGVLQSALPMAKPDATKRLVLASRSVAEKPTAAEAGVKLSRRLNSFRPLRSACAILPEETASVFLAFVRPIQ